jgi:broad specificity phosphatase PhoE
LDRNLEEWTLAELFMVRHGQASFGTGNYDQLSALGERQGVWLGEYFAERGIAFDRVVTGSMQRHRQTADAIFRGLGGAESYDEDPGLNEYDFHGLYGALGDDKRELKALASGSMHDFYKGLKQVLRLWSEDAIDGPLPESWGQFQQRVSAAREDIQGRGGRRVLVVSSGGPMAAFAQQVMQAPASTAIELNMQIRNTAICQYFFNAESCHLASFNGIPHLDLPQRRDCVTYG